nr:solute carrier family 2, facilitated glucose transporter member 5-like [Ciona intestinalis]|eukprot:XP_002119820.3 solute carrier family 2, facilitated glucose transporter member 5-like [Ciona intestinalis]
MSTAYLSHSYESVIIGRFLMGMFCALVLGSGPIYVSEILPPHLRAPIGSLFSVSIGLGIMLGNVLGFQQVLGTTTGWPILLSLNVVPSLIFLSYCWRMPKSPRSLYFDHNKPEEARKVLQRLYGTDDVSKQIEQYRIEAETMSKRKILSPKQVLTSRKVKWQLISGLVICVGFQFTGINGIFFYLNTLLTVAGIPEEIMDYVTIGFVSMEFLGAFAGLLSNKLGRKTMLLAGYSISMCSMIIYTLATAYQPSVDWLSYVSVVGGVGMIFGFAIGPGPITYVIIPELLDQSARPTVMMFSSLSLWVCFTIISVVTPYLFDYLKFAAFLPFAAILFLAILYVWFVVPETKGKSVLAIQMYFSKWNKIPVAQVLTEESNNGDNDVTNTGVLLNTRDRHAVTNPSFLNDGLTVQTRL